MALYGYTAKDGSETDAEFPMGKAPKSIMRKGKRYYKNAFDRSSRTQLPSTYPMVDEGLGCHPSQIPEFQRRLAEAGVPTGFTADGGCLVDSVSHHNAVRKVRDIKDLDACYRQYAGEHG